MLNGEKEHTQVQSPAGALPANEARERLTARILPRWTSAAAAHTQPVAVLVADQPGAGKTMAGDWVQAALERRGPVVRVCSDLYKATHPSYAELLAEDVRLAGAGVRADVRLWQAAVEEHVRAHGLDAVVETALADADGARAASVAYRAAGHRIELVVVATAPAASAQGILDRYLATHADGGGRWVSWENHDACVAGLLSTLVVVEDEHLVDRVTVVRRDHTVLYTNHLDHTGRWAGEPGAAAAVDTEHRRWWTAPETAAFRLGLTLSDRRLHRDVQDEDRRLAVQRDAERAAALAEPVRRTAQPIRKSPGVHYHRLSSAEHRWTFDALIVPGYLADITAHDQPVTTYVMGQPGAGKTDAAYLVRRAARHRRPVKITGDDFKNLHPDYWNLLVQQPRTAGARIRADYTAWQRQAEAYVRQHRGDMTIEISPGNAEQFLECARTDRLVRLLKKNQVLRTKDFGGGQVTGPEVEDLLRDTLVQVAVDTLGWNVTATAAAQPGRRIVDIFTAEITGFSKYKLAKAFLQWLATHGWGDLTSDEQQAWQALFAAVNKGLA